MSYQVLARKWRPQNFSELVGQTHVLKGLVHAFEANRLHHAYLFTGTRGVGKTTIARIIAKCLNCEKGVTAEPCGTCSACVAITEGRFVDLIEIDAASRTKVEDTRALLDNVQYMPSVGRYKVYLIDEVHMLSAHSFNALLKTLEEPPAHVKFLLATTDPQKLPITILSRCLQFHLKNIQPIDVKAHLMHILEAEKITYDEQALMGVANAAQGSLRDALSLLDQAIAFGQGMVKLKATNEMLGLVMQDEVFDVLHAVKSGEIDQAMQLISTMSECGCSFQEMLSTIAKVLHHAALVQQLGSPTQYTAYEFELPKIEALAARFSAEEVQLWYQIVLMGQKDLPLAPDEKLGFEMVMMRLAAFTPVNLGSVQSKPAQAIVISEKATQQAAPVIKTAQPVKQESVVPIEEAPLLEESTDWKSIVSRLTLQGMSKQLALHCTLSEKTETSVKLHISESQSQLLQDRAKDKLEKALTVLFQKPIKLYIDIAIQQKEATPAKIIEKQREDEQSHMESAIYNDPNVQYIQQNFNADIVPGSITKTN